VNGTVLPTCVDVLLRICSLTHLQNSLIIW